MKDSFIRTECRSRLSALGVKGCQHRNGSASSGVVHCRVSRSQKCHRPPSVVYILSLSLSRRRKNTQALPTDCPRIENNNGREEHGVSWLLGFLLVTQPSRPLSALFALCRVSNPPTLLSTTTREMVIRYGLEVARDISLLNDTALLSSFLLPFPTCLHPVVFSIHEICLKKYYMKFV